MDGHGIGRISGRTANTWPATTPMPMASTRSKAWRPAPTRSSSTPGTNSAGLVAPNYNYVAQYYDGAASVDRGRGRGDGRRDGAGHRRGDGGRWPDRRPGRRRGDQRRRPPTPPPASTTPTKANTRTAAPPTPTATTGSKASPAAPTKSASGRAAATKATWSNTCRGSTTAGDPRRRQPRSRSRRRRPTPESTPSFIPAARSRAG